MGYYPMPTIAKSELIQRAEDGSYLWALFPTWETLEKLLVPGSALAIVPIWEMKKSNVILKISLSNIGFYNGKF